MLGYKSSKCDKVSLVNLPTTGDTPNIPIKGHGVMLTHTHTHTNTHTHTHTHTALCVWGQNYNQPQTIALGRAGSEWEREEWNQTQKKGGWRERDGIKHRKGGWR